MKSSPSIKNNTVDTHLRRRNGMQIKDVRIKEYTRKVPDSKVITDKVKLCTVRKTKPSGPMTVCHDMYCFDACVEETKRQRDRQNEKEETKNDN